MFQKMTELKRSRRGCQPDQITRGSSNRVEEIWWSNDNGLFFDDNLWEGTSELKRKWYKLTGEEFTRGRWDTDSGGDS